MTQFEFVQITFAIILGLGVTSILASLGDQIRLRHIKKLSLLHLFAQSLLLYTLLIWLWGFWAAREINWNITIFIFHALSPIFLALAAHMSRVEFNLDAETIENQYFRNAKTFYGFWALAAAIGIGQTYFYVLIGELPSEFGIILSIVRGVSVALLLTLAMSKKITVHWACLIILTLIYSSLLLTIFFSLEGSA